MDENFGIPENFYIFVNFGNSFTRHNFNYTKTFSSAAIGEVLANDTFRKKYLSGEVDYLPFIKNEPDLKGISPFCLNIINNYRVEHDAEVVRRKFFSDKPSRLSAIFAFGDYESCVLANAKYLKGGWDLETVRKGKLINTGLNKIAKLNMEIVSLARTAYNTSSLDAENIENIWKAYWSGQDNLKIELPDHNFNSRIENSGVIWEYLLEGAIKFVDE